MYVYTYKHIYMYMFFFIDTHKPVLLPPLPEEEKENSCSSPLFPPDPVEMETLKMCAYRKHCHVKGKLLLSLRLES